MSDVKEAVRLATEYLSALLDVEGVRLEETEEAEGEWFITLSHLQPNDGQGALAQLAALSPHRVYKQFRIVDGKVKAMKIREFEGV